MRRLPSLAPPAALAARSLAHSPASGLCKVTLHTRCDAACLRYCDPQTMEKHERRNAQPPVNERNIELLIYGVFTAFDGDKGEHLTTWVDLSEVLMTISRETMSAKLASFRDGLSEALEQALLLPAAVPAAAPAASPVAAGTGAVEEAA